MVMDHTHNNAFRDVHSTCLYIENTLQAQIEHMRHRFRTRIRCRFHIFGKITYVCVCVCLCV